MILESICLFFLRGVLNFILNTLPDILTFSETSYNSINHVLDIIFNNLQFLGMFIRLETIKVLFPLALFLANLEKTVGFALWLLKKIPGLNIS